MLRPHVPSDESPKPPTKVPFFIEAATTMWNEEELRRFFLPMNTILQIPLSQSNVDTAVSKQTGRGTIAAVARSEVGVFFCASAVVLPGRTDPEILEALACREGIALACGRHILRVIVR
jgi:hypothetical protein